MLKTRWEYTVSATLKSIIYIADISKVMLLRNVWYMYFTGYVLN